MKLLFIIFLGVGLGKASVAKSQTLPMNQKKLVKVVVAKPVAKSVAKPVVIGVEARHYNYLEPDMSIPVNHTGLLFGIWSEWYWENSLSQGKLYGNVLYGDLDYQGSVENQNTQVVTPHSAKTTDLIVKINSNIIFDLNKFIYIFAGGGFRYLYDRGVGSEFYTRTGNWVYLPLGAGFNYEKFSVDIEYDLIVYGSIKSNLSEAISTLPDLTNTQTGYGLLITTRYRINEFWALYGIYEFWNLEKSNLVTVSAKQYHEPMNSSQSFGLKLGYHF